MQSLKKPIISIQLIVKDGSDYDLSGDELEDSLKKQETERIRHKEYVSGNNTISRVDG